MSGGGGKGGSTTSKVEIPSWAQDAAKKNIAMGEYAGKLGYMPYYGLDVAAQSPMQQMANEGFYGAAQAFGQAPSGRNVQMQPAQTVDGVQGYSSGGLFDQAVQELSARRPAQAQAYNDMFIDPMSGGTGVAFTPRGSVGSNEAVDLNMNKFVDSGSGAFTGVQPTMSEWDMLMGANNFNQFVDGYPVVAPAGMLAKGISYINDKAIIDPYEAQRQVQLEQYKNGAISSTGDSGFVSGNYGGETLSYGTADSSGRNSASTTAGGSSRTDNGFGW